MDRHKWLHAYKTFSVCIVFFFSHIGNSTNSHILLRRAPFIKTTIYVIPNSQLKPSEFGNCCSHGQMELDGMNCMFTGHSKNVTQQGPDSQCKILEGMLLYYRLLCSLRIQLSYLWILLIKLAVDYLAVLWYRTVALQQGRLFSILSKQTWKYWYSKHAFCDYEMQ